MRKKALSLVMAAVMAASLTACGSKPAETTAAAETTTAAAAETKAEDTTAAAESKADETKAASDAAAVDVSAWKDKQVTCIVPYDAGGGTDTVMRALADAAKGSFKNITVSI